MVGKNEMGDFCGSSNIVDPNGTIIATCGEEKETIVYADINVRDEILNARAAALQTWLKERVPKAYKINGSGGNLQGLTPLTKACICSENC